MTNKKRITAVIAGAELSPPEIRLAEEVDRQLAMKGDNLICGGMESVVVAAYKGVQLEGGITIGVLPGNSRKTANPYVQIPIVTDIGYTQNIVVVKSAQAVIAIGGSYGTLSEISYALQSGIPVIGLNTWSLSRNDQWGNSIILAQNLTESVNKALNLAKYQ